MLLLETEEDDTTITSVDSNTMTDNNNNNINDNNNKTNDDLESEDFLEEKELREEEEIDLQEEEIEDDFLLLENSNNDNDVKEESRVIRSGNEERKKRDDKNKKKRRPEKKSDKKKSNKKICLKLKICEPRYCWYDAFSSCHVRSIYMDKIMNPSTKKLSYTRLKGFVLSKTKRVGTTSPSTSNNNTNNNSSNSDNDNNRSEQQDSYKNNLTVVFTHKDKDSGETIIIESNDELQCAIDSMVNDRDDSADGPSIYYLSFMAHIVYKKNTTAIRSISSANNYVVTFIAWFLLWLALIFWKTTSHYGYDDINTTTAAKMVKNKPEGLDTDTRQRLEKLEALIGELKRTNDEHKNHNERQQQEFLRDGVDPLLLLTINERLDGLEEFVKKYDSDQEECRDMDTALSSINRKLDKLQWDVDSLDENMDDWDEYMDDLDVDVEAGHTELNWLLEEFPKLECDVWTLNETVNERLDELKEITEEHDDELQGWWEPPDFAMILPNSTIQTVENDGDWSQPQTTAYQWLTQDPFLHSYPDWRILQRFALAALFFSTSKDHVFYAGKSDGSSSSSWKNKQSWLDYTTHECHWYSTAGKENNICSADGRYRILSLYDNRLQGPLPEELFAFLPGLREINLHNNALTGVIPSTRNNEENRDLQALNLYNNKLDVGSIPTHLARFVNLKYLFLGGNQFSGTVPKELLNLTSLEYAQYF